MDASLLHAFTRNGRAFFVPLKQTWWERFLGFHKKYDILVFSNQRLEDLPTQFPYPLPPKDLDAIARHHWRVQNGYSYVTKTLEEVLNGK